MDGFVVIDKPAGITSHDVVGTVRRIFRQKKVGHTGTLDPFATGVLPVALGEATKAISFLDESVKEYKATMRLGVSTDTQDLTGTVIRSVDYGHVIQTTILDAVRTFVGVINQTPPMYSALKRNGIPLYRLARQGCDVERDARQIEVFSLVIDAVELPYITFTVTCSRGTYVRTLASDIGDMIGCGAHLVSLRRTMSGTFSSRTAVSLEELAVAHENEKACDLLVSPRQALNNLRELQITERGVEKISHGVVPNKDEVFDFSGEGLCVGERLRLAKDDKLLAVAENLSILWGAEAKNLRLLRVFN